MPPLESFARSPRMNDNIVLRDAIAPYADEGLRKEYADVLGQSEDRVVFYSLLIAAMCRIPLGDAIQARNRDAFLPVDAARVFSPDATNPTPEALTAAGRRVRDILTRDQLDILCRYNRAATDEEIGNAYFEARRGVLATWNQNGRLRDRSLTDPVFGVLVRTPVQLFRQARAALDSALAINHISTGNASATQLSRREYLGLLAINWHGRTEDVRIAAGRGLVGLRALLIAESVTTRQSQAVYDQLMFEHELGPGADSLARNIATVEIDATNRKNRLLENRRREEEDRKKEPNPNTIFDAQLGRAFGRETPGTP